MQVTKTDIEGLNSEYRGKISAYYFSPLALRDEILPLYLHRNAIIHSNYAQNSRFIL